MLNNRFYNYAVPNFGLRYKNIVLTNQKWLHTVSNSKIGANTYLGISLSVESNKFDLCNKIKFKVSRILKTEVCYCVIS